ncbi:MAG: hypothetical protein ACJ71B_13235 [Nitrososphaera sp.]
MRLFTVVVPFEKIFFPSDSARKGDLIPEGKNERQYSKFCQMELEVHFGSKTGRFLQNPYRKKIEDIVKDARTE